MNRDFWRGRRVLVTGHTGFKGSWLCAWLHAMGADVAGYSSGAGAQTTAAGGSLFERARVGELVRSFDGDVGDLDRLQDAFASHRPEVVFHMAAQPLVRRSYEDPVGTFRSNLVGTVNVLESARRAADVRALVNVTTDKVYENRELRRGYREDDPLGGSDPYSASKAASELATAAYRQSFFSAEDSATAVATARSGNVIGGGDFGADRLIPDLVRGALAGQPVLIRNPAAVRPWQHVLNPLSGYLLLAERLADSREWAEPWNFGPDPEDVKPVGWIADRLRELWGDDLEWVRDEGVHPHETSYLSLDSSKARERLGWVSRWDLGQGLERIVAWHTGVRDGEDARELCLAQTEQFERSPALGRGG